jgi:hypothetical protein
VTARAVWLVALVAMLCLVVALALTPASPLEPGFEQSQVQP